MVSHRAIKKTVYATGFFLAIAAVATLIVLPLVRDTSKDQVESAPTQSYVPVVLENVTVIPHITTPGPRGKTVDVVVRLKNENPRAGTGSYPILLSVKDTSGEVVHRTTQDMYVLPGGLQYVVALDLPIPSDKTFGTVEVTPPVSSTLTALPNTARLPDFSVFLRNRTTITSGSYKLEQQTGVVTNNSTFDWQRVEIIGVALDAQGNIIGVGKTFVGKLLVGEQREFTLQWPLPDSTTSRVIALATTNIYSDANIVHILGDPGLLR